MTCDLADRASLVALAAQVDCLDALVVTAGVSPIQADVRTVFDIDLAGMARVLEVFDDLVSDGTAVVCIASMAAHLGADHVSSDGLSVLDDPLGDGVSALTDDPGMAYMMAKIGVQRLVRRKAVTWGPRAPAASRCHQASSTPRWVRWRWRRRGAARQRWRSSACSGVLAPPRRSGGSSPSCCTPAASFITGTDILVDGGVVAALRS